MKKLRLLPSAVLAAILMLCAVSSCGLRAREGEDLHPTNEVEATVIKSNLTYIHDERTGLCFAILNNSTDGFRSTFSITCVPCDSLKPITK